MALVEGLAERNARLHDVKLRQIFNLFIPLNIGFKNIACIVIVLVEFCLRMGLHLSEIRIVVKIGVEARF